MPPRTRSNRLITDCRKSVYADSVKFCVSKRSLCPPRCCTECFPFSEDDLLESFHGHIFTYWKDMKPEFEGPPDQDMVLEQSTPNTSVENWGMVILSEAK